MNGLPDRPGKALMKSLAELAGQIYNRGLIDSKKFGEGIHFAFKILNTIFLTGCFNLTGTEKIHSGIPDQRGTKAPLFYQPEALSPA